MSRIRAKACDRCGTSASILYRVRWNEVKQWQFVCPDCWPPVQAQPGYTYGGTWKAKKRH
ncbi:MAG: hypothetical protein AAGF66_05935 [Cyanobacteria bacterium P01_H01_bin.119]